MTFKITYWDEVEKVQKERYATPEEVAQRELDLAIKIVPQKVTRRQAMQALFLAGKLADVEPAINTLPSPQKELGLIEWQESLEFERNRPMVHALGPLLNLTPEDIDNLFIQASQL